MVAFQTDSLEDHFDDDFDFVHFLVVLAMVIFKADSLEDHSMLMLTSILSIYL